MSSASNFNKSGSGPVILVCPLDWGLGHTTRCIPLIRELLALNCRVLIACNSTQKSLLKQEFNQVNFINLAGYNLHYTQKRWSTIARLVLQAPKIAARIKTENNWLKAFLTNNQVDAVITDNRYGLHHPSVPTVFITHQLHIRSGMGTLIDHWLQRRNYQFINRFTTCWVPDFEQLPNLAGQLSHTTRKPVIPVQYLGGLSRFTPCQPAAQQLDLLIILSGPEPQRTLFEKILLHQLQHYQGSTVLVRGLPGNTQALPAPAHVRVLAHAPAQELNALLCSAGMVISRAGYTTVMDLTRLGKKSILVPTPGQAEQEYLGRYLHAQQLAYSVAQHRFSLQAALDATDQFPYKILSAPMEQYKAVVQQWVNSLCQ